MTVKEELNEFIWQQAQLGEPAVAYSAQFGTMVLGEMEPSFSEAVISMAKERFSNMRKFSERAYLSPQVVSKMNTNPVYLPEKRTALACILALELDEESAQKMLQRAGYSFSSSSMLDLVVLYCIRHEIFSIQDINDVLYDNKLPLLGSL